MAEVALGVIMTLKARSGCLKCNSSGSVAQAQKQSDVTSAKRATGSNTRRPKPK